MTTGGTLVTVIGPCPMHCSHVTQFIALGVSQWQWYILAGILLMHNHSHLSQATVILTSIGWGNNECSPHISFQRGYGEGAGRETRTSTFLHHDWHLWKFSKFMKMSIFFSTRPIYVSLICTTNESGCLFFSFEWEAERIVTDVWSMGRTWKWRQLSAIVP